MELLKSISYGKRFWIYLLVGFIFAILCDLIPFSEGTELTSIEYLVFPFFAIFLYCYIKAGRNWFFWEATRRSGLWKEFMQGLTVVLLAINFSTLVIGYFLGWMSQEPNGDELFCTMEESK